MRTVDEQPELQIIEIEPQKREEEIREIYHRLNTTLDDLLLKIKQRKKRRNVS